MIYELRIYRHVKRVVDELEREVSPYGMNPWLRIEALSRVLAAHPRIQRHKRDAMHALIEGQGPLHMEYALELLRVCLLEVILREFIDAECVPIVGTTARDGRCIEECVPSE